VKGNRAGPGAPRLLTLQTGNHRQEAQG
jgi:hypothetical protein